MEDYSYRIELSVRDYECDIQGIVNNAVYQNYLEHARHEYLKSLGINFNEFAQKGINLVVLRVEKFFIGVKMERISRIKFAFTQDIYRLPDNHQIIKGKVIGTALNTKGRPKIPEEIEKLFIRL